jgi:16S rRNA (uracil1498-N3)-methyltransferase
MPRLFAPTEELAGAEITLGGESHRYLTRVLRFGTGDRVELFDGRGLEIAATIVRAGSREVTLRLGERRRATLPTTPPVTLLQGLPRAERMELVIQKATELGAARVIPVRVVRSATGQQARTARWEKIALEAARQCGRADSMLISPLVSLPEALASLTSPSTRLVPWEEAPGAESLGRALPHVIQDGDGDGARARAGAGVDVLIGPEGGLTAGEVTLATEAGFRVVTLGPRILRTETAAIVALTIIQSHVGALG